VAPNQQIIAAMVVHYHTSGSLFVRISNGYHLKDLHDVHVPTPADGQVLTWVDANDRWEAVEPAGSGTGQNLTKVVTQSSHGLAVGDVVRFNGTAYVEAQANSAANAEVVGIVSAVASSGEFTLTISGEVTGLSGLTAGEAYFLSAATAGALTATAPSSTGQVVKPVFIAVSTTSGYFFNMRGELISASASPTTSYIEYRGSAGNGSTNTWVVRWTTNAKTVGTDITYVGSATAGDSFRINKAGRYSVSVQMRTSSASFAVKKNTAVNNNFTLNETDTYAGVNNNTYGSCSTVIDCAVNDVIFCVNSGSIAVSGMCYISILGPL
jgi:hypothetical protein